MSFESVPIFRDIEDVDSIYQLISDQRQRSSGTKG